ncbi:MAG: hypothetical protein ACRDOM_05760, partial [Nocardioides sp.]
MTSPAATSLAARLRGRPELGIAALLGAVGGLVLWDAAGLHAPYSHADPVGPRTVPFIVAALLLGCAIWLCTDVL